MGSEQNMVTMGDIGGAEVIRLTAIAQPAAGAEFTITVPGRGTWIPIALRALLTTSAVVANRFVEFSFGDQTDEYARVQAQGQQAASLAKVYSVVRDGGTGATSGTSLVSRMPAIPLLSGHRITSVTTAIDVGDQWSEARLLAVEYQRSSIAYVAELIAQFGNQLGLYGAMDQPASILG